MYENKMNRKKKIFEKGGTINKHMDKVNQENLIAKIVEFSTVFQILRNGRPILDISLYKEFFHFVGIIFFNLPQYHWYKINAWDIANNIVAVEMQDL